MGIDPDRSSQIAIRVEEIVEIPGIQSFQRCHDAPGEPAVVAERGAECLLELESGVQKGDDRRRNGALAARTGELPVLPRRMVRGPGAVCSHVAKPPAPNWR